MMDGVLVIGSRRRGEWDSLLLLLSRAGLMLLHNRGWIANQSEHTPTAGYAVVTRSQCSVMQACLLHI